MQLGTPQFQSGATPFPKVGLFSQSNQKAPKLYFLALGCTYRSWMLPACQRKRKPPRERCPAVCLHIADDYSSAESMSARPVLVSPGETILCQSFRKASKLSGMCLCATSTRAAFAFGMSVGETLPSALQLSALSAAGSSTMVKRIKRVSGLPLVCSEACATIARTFPPGLTLQRCSQNGAMSQ